MQRVLQSPSLHRSLQSRLGWASAASSSNLPQADCLCACTCASCCSTSSRASIDVALTRQYSSHRSGSFCTLLPAPCNGARTEKICNCTPCQSISPSIGSFAIGQRHNHTALQTWKGNDPSRRQFSTYEDHQDEIENINEAFVNARDEIEYAKEDSETVYFNEAHDTAKKAVAETLDKFEGLLAALPKPEADKLQRSMGMKMQQLKAELLELDELHA